MSGITTEKYWRIGNYQYAFYRYSVESACKGKYGNCILDAGCGERVSSLSKFPQDSEFVGVDINKQALIRSKTEAKGKYEYVLSSLSALPFKTKSFSLVVCVDVLEHVKDKTEFVEEISRVILPKGFFIGSTTNMLNPFMLVDTLLPKQFVASLERIVGKHYDRHKRLTMKGLTRLINQFGFTCKLAIYGFPPIQPWVYHHQHKRFTWYARLWILFDRLALSSLKENMVFVARVGMYSETRLGQHGKANRACYQRRHQTRKLPHNYGRSEIEAWMQPRATMLIHQGSQWTIETTGYHVPEQEAS